MPIQKRTLGYAPGVQRLVWPRGTDVPVTAYLWGGGGGGGGNDLGIGGTGQGGGATEVNFLVSEGDVLDIAVGGPGGGGQSSKSQAGGGEAGASSVSSIIFDTRSAVTSPPVIASTNSSYVAFLNTYGVWVNPVTARNFDRSYVVNFPITALYTFTGSADNSAEVYVNDVFVGAIPGFQGSWSYTFNVTAGNAVVRIIGINTGGPGSVALTINSGISYSGSHGGQAGPSGSSGGGGGGGGATVIFKNGTALAVAAGGGGGAGAGQTNGDNAPGSSGQASDGISSGQNGQNHPGDGGGAGGGGGGQNGGNGGLVRIGDQGALAGVGGFSSSPAGIPTGRTPGNATSEFYPGSAGTGGTATSGGNAGAAVLLFDTPGLFVHTEISFEPVKDSWVRLNNNWIPVETTYIKRNGAWQPLLGSFAPDFDVVREIFGEAPRPATATAAEPVYVPPTFDSAAGWDGPDAGISAAACGDGSGGCKVICTAMNQAYGFGSFRNAIWIAYADKHLTKAHEVGYHTLFLPLVDFGFNCGNGKINMIVRKIMEWGTRYRSIDLRAQMRGTKRNTTGRIIRMIFEPLCYVVGKLKGY